MRTHFAAVSIRAWLDYECSTSIAKFTPVTTIIFLLNKICDGGSSKEPFLKAATLSILICAYPRETKTNNGNFKNAAILPSKVAYRWRACALILPLCRFKPFSAKITPISFPVSALLGQPTRTAQPRVGHWRHLHSPPLWKCFFHIIHVKAHLIFLSL